MTSDSSQKKINSSQADFLARLFNVTMNSAILYGGNHPTTLRNVTLLYSSFEEILKLYGSVSFIVNRDNLFVEEWPVADVINPRRLVVQFIRIGIVSVTFMQGLNTNDLKIFIEAASDIGNDVSAGSTEKILHDKKISTIKINFVRFGKILSGQENDNIDTNEEPVTNLTGNRQKLKDVLNTAVIDQNSSDNALMLIQKLKTEIATAPPQTLDEFIVTLHDIKRNLAEVVESRKLSGQSLVDGEQVSVNLNELTCQTVLKLIKEEYNRGDVSIKRLAQIIRRILPDLSELRRLLPGIKTMLIAEGMSLTDYLQLIKSLNLEIDCESIADSLEGAAEKIGVTAKEIIDAIKKEPEDAARLIYLASEIRQGSVSDELQLSNLLTEYIEKTSKALALQSNAISGPQGGKTLRKILSQIQVEIVNKLNECGVQPVVLQSVKKQLSENFEYAFDSATMDWILKVCLDGEAKNPSELDSRICGFLDHQSQLSRIQDTLSESLLSNGFNSEKVQKIFSGITGNTHTEIQTLTMPSESLSVNNMLFLLNREINQHKRYCTPFSTMVYTIEKVGFDNRIEDVKDEDKKMLIPQLFKIIKKYLREIDLLGMAGIPDVSSLFSIMAMTDYDGAMIVKNRIIKSLEKKKLDLNGVAVNIKVAISITVPQKPYCKDIRSYLNLVRLNHLNSSDAHCSPVKKESKSIISNIGNKES
ncbi:MAG TPA: hypothetical protein VHP36_06220 [Chitinispirillaceae bacterium]|nr:hypothetical protein [Chitinispirillaceae bacterium]